MSNADFNATWELRLAIANKDSRFAIDQYINNNCETFI